MPDSLPPHGLQPTRLLCPWDFLGKDTGVGCHLAPPIPSSPLIYLRGLSFPKKYSKKFKNLYSKISNLRCKLKIHKLLCVCLSLLPLYPNLDQRQGCLLDVMKRHCDFEGHVPAVVCIPGWSLDKQVWWPQPRCSGQNQRSGSRRMGWSRLRVAEQKREERVSMLGITKHYFNSEKSQYEGKQSRNTLKRVMMATW